MHLPRCQTFRIPVDRSAAKPEHRLDSVTLHRISKLPGARDSTGGITIRRARKILSASDDCCRTS